MRFEGNATDGQDSLPTFIQWCKANKDKKTPDKFVIVKVWTPNKFPDLTLETEVFRLRISHKSSVFKALEESLQEFIEQSRVLSISEIDREEYDYVIEVLEGEVGEWTELGAFGWKCTVQEKPKRARRKQKA